MVNDYMTTWIVYSLCHVGASANRKANLPDLYQIRITG